MYKLINIGTQANSQIREYIADTEDDISTLPDSDPFGSTVFVIETSATYMKNSAGEYVEIVVSGGRGGRDNAPFEINATISVDQETGKQTVTTDKTAGELYAEITSGKMVTVNMDMSGGTGVFVVPKTVFIDAQVVDMGAGNIYEFSFSTVSASGGLIGFIASDLSADDIVVFRQV